MRRPPGSRLQRQRQRPSLVARPQSYTVSQPIARPRRQGRGPEPSGFHPHLLCVFGFLFLDFLALASALRLCGSQDLPSPIRQRSAHQAGRQRSSSLHQAGRHQDQVNENPLFVFDFFMHIAHASQPPPLTHQSSLNTCMYVVHRPQWTVCCCGLSTVVCLWALAVVAVGLWPVGCGVPLGSFDFFLCFSTTYS